MKILDILKAGVSIALNVGMGEIVRDIAKGAVENSKGFKKICTVISVSALSGYVADKVSGHINEQIDDIGGKLRKKLVADTEENDEEDE